MKQHVKSLVADLWETIPSQEYPLEIEGPTPRLSQLEQHDVVSHIGEEKEEYLQVQTTQPKYIGNKLTYYTGWVLKQDLTQKPNSIKRIIPQGRLSIIHHALSFLHTPYLWGGASRHHEKIPSGVDCSGLVYLAYKYSGYQIPRDCKDQWKLLKKTTPKKLLQGDLIFFVRQKKVSHVAIYLGDHQAIHSPKTGEKVSLFTFDPSHPFQSKTQFSQTEKLYFGSLEV